MTAATTYTEDIKHSRVSYSLDMFVNTEQVSEAEKGPLEIIRRAAKAYELRNKTATSESRELLWINATSTYYVLPQLFTELRDIFAAAKYEYFEDGVESTFSNSIIQLVEQYGDDAVQALQSMVSKNLLELRLVAEAFSWLGQMENPISHAKRRELLEENLSHRSPYVRDGAMVGLAYMNDPKSTKALKNALQHEDIGELREYIKETIEQLERTQSENR